MVRILFRKLELLLKIKILEHAEDRERTARVRVSKGKRRGNRGVVNRKEKINDLREKYQRI